jgi:hypothetical protein
MTKHLGQSNDGMQLIEEKFRSAITEFIFGSGHRSDVTGMLQGELEASIGRLSQSDADQYESSGRHDAATYTPSAPP